MKLSVIIPLYNCGSYILRCLESICNQGLGEEDFEIIVVNDGSNDTGPEYVAEFAKTHHNVRLINQENSGVAVARNTGLETAGGEWIHFVDADDYLIPNSYKFILDNKYTEGCKILKISSKTVGEVEEFQSLNNSKTAQILYDDTSIGYVSKYGFNGAVITSLYNREFLISNKIFFEPYTCYEDLLFNIRCYTIPDFRVKFTNLIVYLYYVRLSSASRNITSARCSRIIDDCIGINNDIAQIISELRATPTASTYIPILQACQKRLKLGAFNMIEKAKGMTLCDMRTLSKKLYTPTPPLFYPINSNNWKDRAKNFLTKFPFFFWIAKKIK